MALDEGRVTANGVDFAYLGVRLRAHSPSACTASPTPPTPGATSCRMLAEAGYRAVAPFMRGYAPTSGARRRPLPDGRARHRRPRPPRRPRRRRAGSDHRPRLGCRRRPTAPSCTSPSAGRRSSASPCRRAAALARAILQPAQLKRSLVHVLLPAPAGRPGGAGRRPRVHRHAVGRLVTRASTPPSELAHGEGEPPRPGQPAGRARLLPGRARRPATSDPDARGRCDAKTSQPLPVATFYGHGGGRRLHRRRRWRRPRRRTMPAEGSEVAIVEGARPLPAPRTPDDVNRRIVEFLSS